MSDELHNEHNLLVKLTDSDQVAFETLYHYYRPRIFSYILRFVKMPHLAEELTHEVMFPNGQEAWTEFRRTGYPKIWPVVVNYSGGTINTQAQIRRIPYPTGEYTKNATGLANAVTLLGGPDNGGTKLWWDQK